MTLWQDITYKIQHTSSKLYFLIGCNIALFVIGLFVPTIYQIFALPSDIKLFAEKFWTPFSYMFLTPGILMFIFNTLWLYWIGGIFEDYLGYKRIVGVYMLGGLAGAILFYVFTYGISALSPNNPIAAVSISGGTACLLAIIVSTAMLLPDNEIQLFIIGRVKLKWLAVAYIAIDLIGTNASNGGEKIAHVGGALFGLLYTRRLQSGNDIVGGITKWFVPKPKMKVVARNYEKITPSKPTQEEIDRILDKISQSGGVNNLTRQEKEILSRASKDEG